jgi:hypothetical protein
MCSVAVSTGKEEEEGENHCLIKIKRRHSSVQRATSYKLLQLIKKGSSALLFS